MNRHKQIMINQSIHLSIPAKAKIQEMEYYRGDTWIQTSHRSQSRKREGIRTHAFEKAAVLLKLDPSVQDHFPRLQLSTEVMVVGEVSRLRYWPDNSFLSFSLLLLLPDRCQYSLYFSLHFPSDPVPYIIINTDKFEKVFIFGSSVGFQVSIFTSFTR